VSSGGTEKELISRLDRSVQPAYLTPEYRSSLKRAPGQPLVPLGHALSELTGPAFGEGRIGELDSDLTRNAVRNGEPLGERIIITGRVLEDDGRPVEGALVEVWQANAAGRYWHKGDQHPAPLDPNFTGAGRMLTGSDGSFTFTTIRPGAYPWRNHDNAWRPAHIHFSVFGRNFASRLVTQMYFPGDPLLPLDPIFNSVPDRSARDRLVARYDHGVTRPEWALGYRFDIVLAGGRRTPFED
jgi:protocatechuate 3,4-dioxygenase beta subunit